MWFENFDHFLVLLIGHSAENDPYPFGMKFPEESSEGARAIDVVRPVEEKPADSLKPPRPGSAVDASNNFRAVHAQALRRANGNSDIVRLVTSEQARTHVRISGEIQI